VSELSGMQLTAKGIVLNEVERWHEDGDMTYDTMAENIVRALFPECEHEFGALGAVSENYCIHCGATQAEVKAG
jgi:hypothetical protein